MGVSADNLVGVEVSGRRSATRSGIAAAALINATGTPTVHGIVVTKRKGATARGDGRVVALEDACWHRLLPLSLGRLKGDEVVCGYHGLVFNSAGRCTYMPAQKTINPSAAVHSYPVIERHQLVWIWPGDPALADPVKMPENSRAVHESQNATCEASLSRLSNHSGHCGDLAERRRFGGNRLSLCGPF